MASGGTPTEAQLRRAVDECFNSGTDAPSSEAFLRQYGTAALRHILERRDRYLLAAALEGKSFGCESDVALAADYESAAEFFFKVHESS